MKMAPRAGMWVASLLLAAAFTPVWAEAEPPARQALVIGNADYGTHPLANPVNDAELIAKTLTDLNFEVTLERNLNRGGLYAAVETFASGLADGAIAIVYYAGHGMQVDQLSFLLPVDMVPTSPAGVRARAYPLNRLLSRLRTAASGIDIVIVDACRNNPFDDSVGGSRSFEQMGLARVVAPRGTLVAYSTAPGQLAEDGMGRKHSRYTEALAARLREPGLSLDAVLRGVAHEVRTQTLDDQQPWYESSIDDIVYLLPPPGVQMVVRAPLQGGGQGQALDGRGTAEAPSVWYMALDADGWRNLEREIGARVRSFTPDEVPLLEYRANRGNVVAQTTLGLAFREGVSGSVSHTMMPRRFGTASTVVTRSDANNTEALRWLRRAAEAGFPMAQVELGEMYYEGRGLEPNRTEAERLFRLAARADYPRPKINLAQIAAQNQPSAESLMQLFEAFRRDAMRQPGQ